jgi:tungstate transport system substrate-binding protein
MVAACESAPPRLRLDTTTSTRDAGLLDVLSPVFERQAGVSVDVIAVGTGEAQLVIRFSVKPAFAVSSPHAKAHAGWAPGSRCP